MSQTIVLIAARARNGIIGRDGALPWRLPADLKRFKTLTMGQKSGGQDASGRPMIMGRKTFESFPAPLPGRRHIVLTRDAGWQAAGAEVAHDPEAALALAGANGLGGVVMVFGGAWAIWGGLLHTSGSSTQLATSIGYAPSMFQWEVGWGDIALGVLGAGCAWKVLRGQWLTAAVVVLAVQYGGDGIGHITQWVAHGNTAPDNIWAIPSDFLQPIVATALLLAYRRQHVPNAASPDRAPASFATENREDAGTLVGAP